jgi:hypothetical protein
MRLASTLALALLLTLPAAAPAQMVVGRLVARETQVSIEGATVHLVSADSQVVAQELTDSTGTFALRAPATGRYFLLASAPGYEASETDYFALGAEGRRITFVIGRAPVQLERVTVEAHGDARNDRLWYGGFYERMRERRNGRFIAREEIRQWQPNHVSDLLRRFPALEVQVGGYGEFGPGRRLAVRLRQPLSIRTRCWSVFYLNGMQVESEAIDTLDPDDIEGIEVYTTGAVPAQFNAVGSACGVIAVWLRSGR